MSGKRRKRGRKSSLLSSSDHARPPLERATTPRRIESTLETDAAHSLSSSNEVIHRDDSSSRLVLFEHGTHRLSLWNETRDESSIGTSSMDANPSQRGDPSVSSAEYVRGLALTLAASAYRMMTGADPSNNHSLAHHPRLNALPGPDACPTCGRPWPLFESSSMNESNGHPSLPPVLGSPLALTPASSTLESDPLAGSALTPAVRWRPDYFEYLERAHRSSLRMQTSEESDTSESRRAVGSNENGTASIAAAAASQSSSGSINGENVSGSAMNSGYYRKFFVTERKLGSGSYGAVFLCRHMLDDVSLGQFAVKIVPVGDDRNRLLAMLREVRALQGLHHVNVVDYKHSWLERYQPAIQGPLVPCLFILMEYADGGSVMDYVMDPMNSPMSPLIRINDINNNNNNNNSHHRTHYSRPPLNASDFRSVSIDDSEYRNRRWLSEAEVWSIMFELCMGIQHLHLNGVVHRDIKPGNLLMSSLGKLDTVQLNGEELYHNDYRVLISDLGQSALLNDLTNTVINHNTGQTGTLGFAPPSTDAWNESSDVWSIGHVLYFLAFSAWPYENMATEEGELIALIDHGLKLDIPREAQNHRSAVMIEVIRRMTEKNPEDRPPLRSVIVHIAKTLQMIHQHSKAAMTTMFPKLRRQLPASTTRYALPPPVSHSGLNNDNNDDGMEEDDHQGLEDKDDRMEEDDNGGSMIHHIDRSVVMEEFDEISDETSEFLRTQSLSDLRMRHGHHRALQLNIDHKNKNNNNNCEQSSNYYSKRLSKKMIDSVLRNSSLIVLISWLKSGRNKAIIANVLTIWCVIIECLISYHNNGYWSMFISILFAMIWSMNIIIMIPSLNDSSHQQNQAWISRMIAMISILKCVIISVLHITIMNEDYHYYYDNDYNPNALWSSVIVSLLCCLIYTLMNHISYPRTIGNESKKMD